MVENYASFDEGVQELERLSQELRELSPYAVEERAEKFERAVTLVRELKRRFSDAVDQLNAASVPLRGE